MKKNENNVFVVDAQTMKSWKPALESFFGDQLGSISEQKQKLLTGIAAKAFANNAGEFEAATESVGFAYLNGGNSQMDRNVSNPNAGGHNGLTAQDGTPGSSDPQYLIGLCLALAAKTIGLELVQHVNATSQNITIDYLTALYNGGSIVDVNNKKVFVVTVGFAKAPALNKTKRYGFFHDGKVVLASFAQQAREIRNGLIFELQNLIEVDYDEDTGALTNVTYIADTALADNLLNSELFEVANDLSSMTAVADADIVSADNTKAIENYVPHQTTNGLKRTLGRREADQGTERGVALDIRNEAYVIGNRVFTGHISRIQLRRLEEQGKAPLTFLSSAMLNEFAQEINYQVISAARALGVSNALAYQDRGTSYNTYFGPSSVTSKAFDAMMGADELVDMENNPVTGQFVTVPNLRLTMQYETIASIGTAICMLIQQACYGIGTDSRYGDGDAVVLPSNLAGYVAASAMFTPLNAVGTVSMDSRTGAKLSGTIGNIKVYVDVMIPEASPFVTVLRTNREVAIDIPGFEQENLVLPGLAYLVKDIVSSVEIIPEGTGGRKVIMDSETDLVAVGDNPEKAYLTFAVEVEIPGLTMRSN